MRCVALAVVMVAVATAPALARQGLPGPADSTVRAHGAPHDFRRLDHNVDGSISLFEAASGNDAGRVGRPLAAGFDRFDTDQDGVLSLREYLDALDEIS